MAGKIFISYRREDSAANALSIGQYLEHEFGRQNVFIDVDMRAGAKFPVVLDERLRACKVMLALIGPKWLAAEDDEGKRCLDNPEDWVRLEIARALTRGITVIPVRVNGAELPKKSILPPDIQGLLDHQATAVTNTGFRNEMAGLARDIRRIPNPARRRGFATGAIGLLILLLVGSIALYQTGLRARAQSALHKIVLFLTGEGTKRYEHATAGSSPEWTLLGATALGFAEFLKLSSVKQFSDRASVITRYVVDTSRPVANGKIFPNADYAEDVLVFDCKSTRFTMSQETVYSDLGNILYTYKWGEPEFLDLSTAPEFKKGDLADNLQKILCNEEMRTPLLTPLDLASMKFTSLASTPDGAGQIFYGPVTSEKNSNNQKDVLAVIKENEDHNMADIFPASVVGLPPSFRFIVSKPQIHCSEPQIATSKLEYYDSKNNLIYLLPIDQSGAIQDNSPMSLLRRIVCALPPA